MTMLFNDSMVLLTLSTPEAISVWEDRIAADVFSLLR
jgi:hypothetical protein